MQARTASLTFSIDDSLASQFIQSKAEGMNALILFDHPVWSYLIFKALIKNLNKLSFTIHFLKTVLELLKFQGLYINDLVLLMKYKFCPDYFK